MTFDEEKILNYISRPLRHLDIADTYELLDSYVFVSPIINGFNLSHLEIDNAPTSSRKIRGSYPLKVIHNVDVSDLNDIIKIIETIYNEKTTVKCDYEDNEINDLFRDIDNNIKIGLLITRFKNSSNWLEFFMEGSEIELAPHKSLNDCLGHMLIWYECEN